MWWWILSELARIFKMIFRILSLSLETSWQSSFLGNSDWRYIVPKVWKRNTAWAQHSFIYILLDYLTKIKIFSVCQLSTTKNANSWRRKQAGVSLARWAMKEDMERPIMLVNSPSVLMLLLTYAWYITDPLWYIKTIRESTIISAKEGCCFALYKHCSPRVGFPCCSLGGTTRLFSRCQYLQPQSWKLEMFCTQHPEMEHLAQCSSFAIVSSISWNHVYLQSNSRSLM